MRNIFLLLIIIFGIPFYPCAQEKLDSIQLINDVQFLSSSNKQPEKESGNGENIYCYIQYRFKEIGVQSLNKNYQQRFKFTENEKLFCGANLIGQIKGTNDSVLVISADFNFLTAPKKTKKIPNNASGVAALLAVANYFKQQHPYYTLVFVILGGSEGGTAFMKHPPVILNKVKLHINIGAIGNNDKRELYASLLPNDSVLTKAAVNIEKRNSIYLVKKEIILKENEVDETKLMSGYSFFNNNIPFIYLHSQEDAFSTKIIASNPSFFYPAVQIIKDFVERINTRSGFLKNQIPPRSKWIMKSIN